MFGSGGKIKIEQALLDKIEKYASIAGYSSAEEFVHHALEKEIAKLEQGDDSEAEIKKRLKGLGYIS